MRALSILLLAALSASADNTINYILFSGQSLSIGTNSGPCLTQLQPPLNATGWVDHSNGTTWPKYNVSYIGTPASFIDLTCRAPQYRTITGTIAIDTSGNVTGVGTNWQAQLNAGILIAAGKEYLFTYVSGTTGKVTPAPAVAVPAGTSYSLSATANGNGFFQSGESHQRAVVNTLTDLHPTKDWVGTTVSAGEQGRAYWQLKKATTYATPYFDNSIANLSAQATFLGANVPGNGRPRAWTVKALDIVHGEADSIYPAGIYTGYLLEWLKDYNDSVKAIRGSIPEFPMFTDQYSSWSRYAATPTITRAAGDPAMGTSYPEGTIYWNTTQKKYRRSNGTSWSDDPNGVCSAFTNGWCGTTPLAQWYAARDNPGRIYLVGPKYQYKYSDGLHLINHSYRQLGEMHGKAMAKLLHQGEPWVPLAPRAITRAGNVITARFWVPVGCLLFDSTRNDDAIQQFTKANQGFEYYDTTSSVSISSVAISSCDTVTVNLSGTPTGDDQRLRYAYTGTSGSIGGTAGAARGTLADDDPAVGLSGLSLRDYAITFDEPIGFAWEPKGERKPATATATEASIKFVYRPAVNEACRWHVSTDPLFNSLVAHGADATGTRNRELLINGLSGSTTYYVRAVCSSGTYAASAVTKGASAEQKTVQLRFRAPAGRNIDHVLVEYGTTPSLGNTATQFCPAACAVRLPNIGRGTAVYVKHTYRTAANVPVAASRVALEIVE